MPVTSSPRSSSMLRTILAGLLGLCQVLQHWCFALNEVQAGAGLLRSRSPQICSLAVHTDDNTALSDERAREQALYFRLAPQLQRSFDGQLQ